MTKQLSIVMKKQKSLKKKANYFEYDYNGYVPNTIQECKECAKEHRQLAEWLTELKQRRQELLDIRDKIEQCKQYKGKSENHVIDSHDVGLDRYFDLGLDKALKIVDSYIKGD